MPMPNFSNVFPQHYWVGFGKGTDKTPQDIARTKMRLAIRTKTGLCSDSPRLRLALLNTLN